MNIPMLCSCHTTLPDKVAKFNAARKLPENANKLYPELAVLLYPHYHDSNKTSLNDCCMMYIMTSTDYDL